MFNKPSDLAINQIAYQEAEKEVVFIHGDDLEIQTESDGSISMKLKGG